MKIFLSIILFFAFGNCVSSVDLSDIEEGDCITPTPDSSFDFNWAVTGASEWYRIAWGKYELYRTISSLLDVAESRLTEDQAARSCVSQTWQGNTAGILTGFAGTRKMAIDFKMPGDGKFEWTHKPNNRPGKRGTSIVTLTDNKNYYVSVSCWSEGKKSYSVVSTEKTLDEDTKKKIFDHLGELGFDSLHRHETSYDDCITLPPVDTPGTTSRPPSSDTSTGNANSSGPFSTIINIFRRKIEFIRGLIMTLLRFLAAPIRFFTQTLGNLRFGRGGADRG